MVIENNDKIHISLLIEKPETPGCLLNLTVLFGPHTSAGSDLLEVDGVEDVP